jgi:hypothetical protein
VASAPCESALARVKQKKVLALVLSDTADGSTSIIGRNIRRSSKTTANLAPARRFFFDFFASVEHAQREDVYAHISHIAGLLMA